MQSLPLKEIIATVLKEFETAGVAADVSREHWRQFYESNTVLKDFSPSRIRVTEANISLPLAFTEISAPKTHTPSLTSMQVLRVLPTEIPMEDRTRIAEATAAYVSKQRRLTFANKNFVQVVHQFVTKHPDVTGIPEKSLAEMSTNLEKLRADFLSQTPLNSERQALFAYQTEELIKLEADRIARFDIKLAID